MLFSELAKEVHANAVAHGWWEDERQAPEIIALIHSEWSEALEEARAGRPMAYIAVETGSQRDPVTSIIPRNPDGRYIAPWGVTYSGKPEGVAVELIDGCIRILDYFGRLKTEVCDRDGAETSIEWMYFKTDNVPDRVPELVAWLHKYTSQALMENTAMIPFNALPLLEAMRLALSWVKQQGLDPLAILLEKHAYNKTRPYKHGKKF